MRPEQTCRLVELRKDRARVIITTGLPEEIARRLRAMLVEEPPAT